MSSVKINRPKSSPNLVRLGDVTKSGWYSYEDNSGIIFIQEKKEDYVQFCENNAIITRIDGMSHFKVYPIEVDLTINVRY